MSSQPSPPVVSCFKVDGLCCATEEQLIRKKLGADAQIRDLRIDLINRTVTVSHTGDQSRVLSALREIGMPGRPVPARPGGPAPSQVSPLRNATVAALALMALGGVLSLWEHAAPLAGASFLAAVVIGGWRIALKALAAVRNRSLDMNFLMTIAVLGAIALGEYAEASAVIVLFALSLLLESMSVDRARRAIHSLMQLSPEEALVEGPEGPILKPVEEVRPGESVHVRPGERVPLDGTVVAGSSTVDESTLTGESLPVPKSGGASVFAGTLNQNGHLTVRVERRSEDSALARIIHLVEEAQQKKAPSQLFVERFARIYTPAVFVLAMAVAVLPPLLAGASLSEWIYRALVLLVIACPCALVISTPVSVISAVTNAARHGILIKGGRHLEGLSAVRTVAFDKTGTLTEGRPEVTDVVPHNSASADQVLRIAALLESRSGHPLGEAIVRKATERGLFDPGASVSAFRSSTGQGIEGEIEGIPYGAGSHEMVESLGICSADVQHTLAAFERDAKTAVVVYSRHKVLGCIALRDVLRHSAPPTIERLRSIGVAPVVLLTGDSQGTANAIAAEIGAIEAKASLSPAEKLEEIRTLRARHGPVAMVGDGVNDAPALAAADVGIAMGGAGSDTALETADLVLMSDDLLKVPYALELGRRATATIRQNIAVALATKGVFLVLGLLGMTSLWLAILADDGATLAVILNSLRLLRRNSA